MKAPVLGELFRKLSVAKFSRTFSTLVKSGVSVLNALDIVSKTSGNKVVEEAVVSCSKAVRDGESISCPFVKKWSFPSDGLQDDKRRGADGAAGEYAY